MGGFVWAVRSGLVWPPFDPGAAARYYDFMPYILHLPWKEEVLIDAPKRSVYQLSLWLSCHIPLAVGGLFLALSMHELRLREILRSSQKITHTSTGGRNARGGAKKLPG